MNEGFEYGSPILDEELDTDVWYTPKENWDNIPKEFLPPPGTCNINFCTDINLRALDAMAQKDQKIEKLEAEVEALKSSNNLFKEQNEALMSKNKILLEKIKSMAQNG